MICLNILKPFLGSFKIQTVSLILIYVFYNPIPQSARAEEPQAQDARANKKARPQTKKEKKSNQIYG